MSEEKPFTRRAFLSMSAAGATTALGGCLGGTGGAEPVSFGLVPVEADVEVTDQWEVLLDYLEEETGVTVEANVVADYASLLQAVRSDRVDVAGSPHSIAVIGDAMGETDIIGQRLILGTKWEFSLITTHPDDDINSFDELEGTTVSLADPLSTPGSLFPLKMMSEGGLDIGDAPQGEAVDIDITYTDHTTARKQLIQRSEVKAAGAGGFSLMAHVPQGQLPDQVADMALGAGNAGSADPPLDLLAASDPIPRPPLIARRNWESDDRDDVENALLNAPEEAFKAEDAEVPLWFDGVGEGSIDDYEPVAEVIEQLGIELEDYES